MRVKLDKSRWDRFWSYWERELPGQIKTAKGQAVRAAGEAIRDEVAGQVRSRVNDPRGRVERWQQLRMGSGGGYIAVSPVSDEAVQANAEKLALKAADRAMGRIADEIDY